MKHECTALFWPPGMKVATLINDSSELAAEGSYNLSPGHNLSAGRNLSSGWHIFQRYLHDSSSVLQWETVHSCTVVELELRYTSCVVWRPCTAGSKGRPAMLDDRPLSGILRLLFDYLFLRFFLKSLLVFCCIVLLLFLSCPALVMTLSVDFSPE